jgi:diacylglycerol kinase (ATP)
VRWTAVVNPGAGRRRRAHHLARLGDELAARAVDIHVTKKIADGLAVARTAFDRGEGVLACGGDGTVRALAGLAAEKGGLLGIVPLGAGNDFARALGFDHRDPLAALAALDTGEDASVDLGRVETRRTREWFTTVAHSGLDGEVNRWANTVAWASGTSLYAMAALRSMATYQPTAMRVTADDSVWEGDAWLVAVGNTHCYGGGMAIVPGAKITDARLDVVIVGNVSRTNVLRCFPQMMRGAHLGIGGVETLSGAMVTIDGPHEQDVWASGEQVGPLPATIEVIPRALRVRVPACSPVVTPTKR